MKDIAIIGYGQYAHVIREMIVESNNFCFKGFIGKKNDNNVEYNDINLNQLKENNIFNLANGIGNISYFWIEDLMTRFVEAGFKFPKILHPSSVISRSATIGDGTVILESAIVKTNATIGQFCLINSGSIVSHDCLVEDFVHISLGAKIGGGCKIGKNSFLGINSSVLQNKQVGNNVIIGAGAVVIDDITDNVVVVGNPAKIIKKREKQ